MLELERGPRELHLLQSYYELCIQYHQHSAHTVHGVHLGPCVWGRTHSTRDNLERTSGRYAMHLLLLVLLLAQP